MVSEEGRIPWCYKCGQKCHIMVDSRTPPKESWTRTVSRMEISLPLPSETSKEEEREDNEWKVVGSKKWKREKVKILKAIDVLHHTPTQFPSKPYSSHLLPALTNFFPPTPSKESHACTNKSPKRSCFRNVRKNKKNGGKENLNSRNN